MFQLPLRKYTTISIRWLNQALANRGSVVCTIQLRGKSRAVLVFPLSRRIQRLIGIKFSEVGWWRGGVLGWHRPQCQQHTLFIGFHIPACGGLIPIIRCSEICVTRPILRHHVYDLNLLETGK